MTPVISVVIPTHNPRTDYLARVIEALKQQTLALEQWEMVVVDNGSRVPLRVGIRHTADGKRPEGEALAGVRPSGSENLRVGEGQRSGVSEGDDSREEPEALRPEMAHRQPQEETGCRGQRADPVEYAVHSTGRGDLKPTNLKHNTPELELGWHANARIVREEELGLTFARLRGFVEAKGELIVMVDDDNVLAPDYLETAVRIAQERPGLGAFGGKCLPEFEVEPEGWLVVRGKGLGLRDRGDREELFPREHTADGIRHEAGDRREEASVSVGQFFGKAVGGSDPPNHRTTEPRLAETALRQTPSHRVTRRVTEFPDCAPIGAGMVLRREAAAAYAERIAQRACGIRHTADGEWQGAGDRKQEPENGAERSETDWSEATAAQRDRRVARSNPELPKNRITEPPKHRPPTVITDRRGDSLASGGDNDICLTVLEEGWQVGYLPQLQLTHLIPKGRMTLDYHKRMARDSMKSYILMLDQHGIRPWPAMPKWTLPLRVASDWWRVKPWQGPEQSLRFWGHVGMYEGRAALRSSAEARGEEALGERENRV